MPPPPDPLPLGRRIAQPKSGAEHFRHGDRELDFDVRDFWRWSASDLLSNATRGVLAEYLVAQALGAARPGDVRDEWAPYDLLTADGVTIEVKSAAYLQSWHQERPSTITFSVRPSQGWSADTGRFEAERRRQAVVYVFALLAHTDKGTVDPLDVGQWEFYVVPTAWLEERVAKQRSLGLAALQKLATAVGFDGLANAVRGAVKSRG